MVALAPQPMRTDRILTADAPVAPYRCTCDGAARWQWAAQAVPSADGTVRLWNPATGRRVGVPLGPLPRPSDHGRLVQFSPGGALIASCWSASPIVVRR